MGPLCMGDGIYNVSLIDGGQFSFEGSQAH